MPIQFWTPKWISNSTWKCEQLSNEFGDRNNLDYDTSEIFCSQQIQIENSQVNNYKLDFVEQMNEVYDDHTDLLFETYMKQREKQNQISTCDELTDNPSFTQSMIFKQQLLKLKMMILTKLLKRR